MVCIASSIYAYKRSKKRDLAMLQLTNKSDQNVLPAMRDSIAGLLIFASAATILLFVCILIANPADANKERYQQHLTNVTSQLEKDGFTIITGDFSLRLDNISNVILEYKGEPWDCKVYSPKNISQNVLFSCGETKANLTDIMKK